MTSGGPGRHRTCLLPGPSQTLRGTSKEGEAVGTQDINHGLRASGHIDTIVNQGTSRAVDCKDIALR